ncbi:helix-turn-helix domain-containing protein [Caballeronia sp. LP006]|uniref:helix-turn-helix domain-containing protein n=1 Tax=Caballeronia sp. LP006 TaxID=3038552 RepID=UPI0028614FD3|nr:helix-turn-helix domain-containing protein [Caballeronia sp. LP006]MDR5832299.1 helix-turn-helix domain-containing protein [Caballeronia sp. LP006]
MTHEAKVRHQPKAIAYHELKTVPKVRLYVERPEEKQWFVHVGHVTDRGRWKTAPHAHPEYGQLIFVRNGRGVMNLEGRSVPFDGPCALLLPTECVHGLDYEHDADRWVVTIEVSYLTQVNSKLDEFVGLWASPQVITLADSDDRGMEVHLLIQRLKEEAESDAVGHIIGTEARLTMLLLALLREARLEEPTSESGTRNDIRVVERFRKLIDEHFRENLPLQDYVSMMAVSLVQLRAACSSAAEQSPTKLIHSRIITEAKRNLIFGDMSVEQIAFGLGFSDAAYFTRFFRREVGQSPSNFRTNAKSSS